MQTAEVVAYLVREGDITRRPNIRDHAVSVGREARCAVTYIGDTRDSCGGIAANKTNEVRTIGVS